MLLSVLFGVIFGNFPYKKMSYYLAYADDVAILAGSKTALWPAFLELAEGATGYGLQILMEEKTKYMVITQRARCFREFINL